MKNLSRLLTVFAVFSLLVGNPLIVLADDNGDGETCKEKTIQGIVQGRLAEKGLSDQDTSKKLSSMSEDDLAYFASHPERLQIAGSGLTTEEIVIAILFLTAGIIIVAVMAESNGF